MLGSHTIVVSVTGLSDAMAYRGEQADQRGNRVAFDQVLPPTTSQPPMYGLSASGTKTDPSACW